MTHDLQMTMQQTTYLQQLKDVYYASYGELVDGKYRYRYSVPELIDKANLEFKYLWVT